MKNIFDNSFFKFKFKMATFYYDISPMEVIFKRNKLYKTLQ